MRPIIFTLFFCSLFFTACNNAADNKKITKDTTKTQPIVVDSFALQTAGIYHGYVPCADCPGIITYLSLNHDMTYRLEETYNKKDDKVVVTTGNWKINNGKVDLHDRNEVRVNYLPDGEKLWQLDHQGNRISGNLGDKYMLTRQPKADNKHLKEKADAGIDFIATGNEPFWSLEIDKGKIIRFNKPDMKAAASVPYAEPTITNGTREYHIQTESAKLDIKVSPQFCSDGMSDFVYEYKVEVEYNKRKYSGCGRLLSEL